MDSLRSRNGERGVVASFATHAEAQEAAQFLADRKVDADCITITREVSSMVGHGARGTGRSYRMVVGAVLGGLLGAVLGMSLGIALLTLPGFALGGLLGALLGPTIQDRRAGDRTPVQMETERHDVVVQRERTEEARRLLAERGFRVK